MKVAHHDHISGKFISSICKRCNFNLKYKKFIPVYIHNLKMYDSHLFVSSLFKYGYQHESSKNITCIPNNEEKYISFSKKIKVDTKPAKIPSESQQWHIDNKTPLGLKIESLFKNQKDKNIMFEIRFIDTFAFMASSIENLSNNLRSSEDVK